VAQRRARAFITLSASRGRTGVSWNYIFPAASNAGRMEGLDAHTMWCRFTAPPRPDDVGLTYEVASCGVPKGVNRVV
jgi:hypothetical protein